MTTRDYIGQWIKESGVLLGDAEYTLLERIIERAQREAIDEERKRIAAKIAKDIESLGFTRKFAPLTGILAAKAEELEGGQ